MYVSYLIEKGWGSYNEIIELTVRDLVEIKIGIESKMQEDQIQKALGM